MRENTSRLISLARRVEALASAHVHGVGETKAFEVSTGLILTGMDVSGVVMLRHYLVGVQSG